MEMPNAPVVDQDAIPAAMKREDAWICWRYAKVDDRWTKLPINPHTGAKASTTNPATWADFETAVEAVDTWKASGVGFVFHESSPFMGIDIDKAIDADGVISAVPQIILRGLNSYTEVSPSGLGYHTIIRGELPEAFTSSNPGKSGKKSNAYEVYRSRRFFTVTGNTLPEYPQTPKERSNELSALWPVMFPSADSLQVEPFDVRREAGQGRMEIPHEPGSRPDHEIIDRATRAANGGKFDALYHRGDTSQYGGDDSAADLALCNILKFWTQDYGQIERIWGRSALGQRSKYQREDYRRRTIEAALDSGGETHHTGGGERGAQISLGEVGPDERRDMGSGNRVEAEQDRIIVRRFDVIEEEEIRWMWPGWLAKGKVHILGGHPGDGKALALDTPIPTPDGWSTIGELSVGDKVFDECGNPCTVTAKSVVYRDDCYRITFSDGEQIVAHGSHEWVTSKHGSRHSPQVRETREISRTVTQEGGKRKTHAIAVADPIVTPEIDLPYDPYALGVWLGDGAKDNATVSIAREDSHIIDRVRARGYIVGKDRTPDHPSCGHYLIRPKNMEGNPALRNAGVLGNKHIPGIYLRSSIHQRLELLYGLMDTDGYASRRNQVEFCTTDEPLAEGFLELVTSLGFKATSKRSIARLNGKEYGYKWRILWTPDRQVFMTPRKASRLSFAVRKTNGLRYIASCDPCESVATQCIEVDSPSHMYLAGRGMIPTHNSSLTAAIASELSVGGKFPDGFPAEKMRTLFIASEDGAGDTVKPRLRIHGADMTMIYNVEGVKREGKSALAGISIAAHIDMIRDLVVEHEIGFLVIDPITSYMRGTDQNSEGSVREALMPLVNMAKEYDIAILCVMHVGKPSAQSSRRPLQMLLGSTAFGGVARNVWITAKLQKNEFEDDDPLVIPTGGEKRILGVTKTNVGLPPPPIEWSRALDAPIVFHGQSVFDLEGALAAGSDAQIDRAIQFLQARLGRDYERKTNELLEEAKEQHQISNASMRRAISKMGCKARKGYGNDHDWYISWVPPVITSPYAHLFPSTAPATSQPPYKNERDERDEEDERLARDEQVEQDGIKVSYLAQLEQVDHRQQLAQEPESWEFEMEDE